MSLRIAFSFNTAWNLFNFRGGVITALLARGDEVITLAPPDPYSEKLGALGCEVVDLPMDNKGTNPIRDLGTLRDFRCAYRQTKPDLALHYTIKPVVYGTLAARSLDVPVVNTITGFGTGFLHGGPLQAVVEMVYRVSQRWPSIRQLWAPYVEAQMESQGARIRIMMNLVPSLLILFYAKKWRKLFPAFGIWFWLAIVSLISVGLVDLATTAVDRISLYFTPLQVGVFARLPLLVREQLSPKLVRFGLVTGHAAVLYVWLNYAAHAQYWLPYRNILFE